MRRCLVAALAVLAVAGCSHPAARPVAGWPRPRSAAPAPSDGRQHVTGAIPAAGTCHLRKAAAGAGDLPDPACTPGATDPQVTQDTIGQTICVHGWTTQIRPPVSETGPAKTRLMRAYNVSGASELDHLVPLELGGSSDVTNLWPEPGPVPDPKDDAESALNVLVCAHGRHLPLAAAQRLVAADWSTAEAVGASEMVP